MEEKPSGQERDRLPPWGSCRPSLNLMFVRGGLVLAFLRYEEVACVSKP